jgi:hypothetical protein
MHRVASAVLICLSACGPVSLAQAERECLSQARLAEQPRGSVGIGVGSDGKPKLRGNVTITSDYLRGRDPSQVYQNCVVRRSGEFPSRSYSSIPAASL